MVHFTWISEWNRRLRQLLPVTAGASYHCLLSKHLLVPLTKVALKGCEICLYHVVIIYGKWLRVLTEKLCTAGTMAVCSCCVEPSQQRCRYIVFGHLPRLRFLDTDRLL